MSGRTLLVGEGNLTFAEANVGLRRVEPRNLTATIYETKADAQKRDADTALRADRLEKQGVSVQYGVDATRLHEREPVVTYDSIVWMFPYPAGAGRARAGVAGAALLSAYFASAKKVLAPGGTVSVTLKEKRYVAMWNPVALAKAAGLKLRAREVFSVSDYPGYTHETTSAMAQKADVSGAAVTFVFEPA